MASGSLLQIYPFSTKPSAPPVGSFLFYMKTDDTLYLQDSTGTEYAFGSTGFISQLTGDVSATGPGSAVATVNFVGGESAADIASAVRAFLAATSSNTANTIIMRDASGNFSANIITANLNGNATTATSAGSATTAINFTGSLIGDVTGTQGATVVAYVDSYSAAQVGASVLLTQNATSANTASTLVERDASGNFSANIISAALNGNASTATTAINFTGSLIGDVTGTQGATVVAYVDSYSAAQVGASVLLTQNATSANTASTLVERDASGNFSASMITANLTGNVTGNATTATTAINFTGSLVGDVTGTQGATSIASSVVTGKLLTGYVVGTNTPILATDSILTAFEKLQGQINETDLTAITQLTGDGTAIGPGSAVFTLATVNSNVGSFGTASSVGSFTVNAKGLITAAANTAIQIAEAQVTGLISDLAGKQPTGNYVTGGSGDVSFSGPGVATTTVNSVGGSSAANIHAAELLANAATALDTPSTIVFRDASGNFSANIISAALNGNVTGNVTGNLTGNVTGNLTGNVTGNVTGTAGNITATTNSTLLTLPSLTLPGAQVSGNIAGSAGSVSGTNVITNSNLAQMPANTIKGNNTGSLANAVDLTAAQVTALLNPFTGDTGSGGLQGLVPAPGAGTKAAGDFLSAVGSWAYVDQSKPIYSPFSLVGITQWTGAVNAKYENIVTYTGIDGHKQYAAIVAGGGAGTLFIWDITNPAIPTLCSYVSLSGAYNIAIAKISGAIYAFVPSSGASVLYTINITNPYSLSTTSSLTISGSPGSLYGCVYANGYVYIGTQNKGLTVVDVGGGLAGGTITVPIQSYQEGGTTNKTGGIAIFGNFVYTTNYQTTFPATVRYFKTWELAAGGGTLAVPFLANTYTIPGGPTPTSTKPSGITISPSGTTAYVSDGNQGVINILDITSPTSPAYVTYITPSYTLVTNTLEEVAVAATVNGNYLYVPSGSNATNGGCIDLFDVTTPASPVKVKSVYTGIPNDVFGGIALNSGYIFAADYGVSGGYSSMAVFTQAALSPVFGLPVTSNIQVQQLTPNTALIANGSQQLASSSTTATELSYVHGVTSPIQAQINSIAGSGITSLTGDVVAVGPGAAASTIQANVVSNSKLAQMAANTLKGNNTGSLANAIDLTTSQVASMLSSYFDASGSASTVQSHLDNYISPTALQFGWDYTKPHYYTQMTYTGSNVTGITYWDSPSMTTQVFTKSITYTGGLATQIVVTRISDGATLTKNLGYSGSSVSTVTRS